MTNSLTMTVLTTLMAILFRRDVKKIQASLLIPQRWIEVQ